MLKAFKDLSKVYYPRNINGCYFEESKKTATSSSSSKDYLLPNSKPNSFCQLKKYINAPNSTYVIIPFYKKSGKNSWKDSWNYCRAQSILQALGWGSMATLGFQIGLPFLKNHFRKFNQNVTNGIVPRCTFTPHLFCWSTHSMPKPDSLTHSNTTVLYLHENEHSKQITENSNVKIGEKSTECSNGSVQELFSGSSTKSSIQGTRSSESSKSDCSSASSKLDWSSTTSESDCSSASSKADKIENIKRRTHIRRHNSVPNLSQKSFQRDHDHILASLEKASESYISEIRNGIGLSAAAEDARYAFKCFKLASFGSNKYALYNLGICYENGLGTSKDLEKAMHYYERASSLGHLRALYNLAVLEMSNGKEELFQKGLNRLKQAADGGIKEAQSYIGCYYSEREEWDKAVEMFAAASSQSDADAMYNLGLCYENGWGVDADLEQAYNMYCKAAEAGSADAIHSLALFHGHGFADENSSSEHKDKISDTVDSKVTEKGKVDLTIEKEDRVADINIRISQSSPELCKSSQHKPFTDLTTKFNIFNYLDLIFPTKLYKAPTQKFWIGEFENESIYGSKNSCNLNIDL